MRNKKFVPPVIGIVLCAVILFSCFINLVSFNLEISDDFSMKAKTSFFKLAGGDENLYVIISLDEEGSGENEEYYELLFFYLLETADDELLEEFEAAIDEETKQFSFPAMTMKEVFDEDADLLMNFLRFSIILMLVGSVIGIILCLLYILIKKDIIFTIAQVGMHAAFFGFALFFIDFLILDLDFIKFASFFEYVSWNKLPVIIFAVILLALQAGLAKSRQTAVEEELDDVRNEKPKYLKTNRGLLKFIGLNIITFGIYSLYNVHSVAKDLNIACRVDGKRTRGMLAFIFLSILTFGIYGMAWNIMVCSRIGRKTRSNNLKPAVTGASWFCWYFFGSLIFVGPLVATAKMLSGVNRVNEMYNGTVQTRNEEHTKNRMASSHYTGVYIRSEDAGPPQVLILDGKKNLKHIVKASGVYKLLLKIAIALIIVSYLLSFIGTVISMFDIMDKAHFAGEVSLLRERYEIYTIMPEHFNQYIIIITVARLLIGTAILLFAIRKLKLYPTAAKILNDPENVVPPQRYLFYEAFDSLQKTEIEENHKVRRIYSKIRGITVAKSIVLALCAVSFYVISALDFFALYNNYNIYVSGIIDSYKQFGNVNGFGVFSSSFNISTAYSLIPFAILIGYFLACIVLNKIRTLLNNKAELVLADYNVLTGTAVIIPDGKKNAVEENYMQNTANNGSSDISKFMNVYFSDEDRRRE